MGKPGPETRLVVKMRQAGRKKYGDRLVVIKYHGSQFGEAGVSDLLCCLDGRFVAAEAKTPTGRVSAKQEAFGARVLAAGGLFAVVRSVEDFLDLLTLAESDPDFGTV